MILRGPQHIHEDLKLRVGDKFLVHCTEDTDYIDPDGIMIGLTGTWLTVVGVSKEKEGREDYHGTRVYGYLHTVGYDDIPGEPDEYCWYWNHMDVIDTAGVPHGLLMLEKGLPHL